MDLSRSTYYYRPVDRASTQKDDTFLQDRIEQLALRFPRYGYRRMTAQLHRDGLKVNHKRVLRIMRQSDLLCKRRRWFGSTTDSDHAHKVYPNLYRNCIPPNNQLITCPLKLRFAPFALIRLKLAKISGDYTRFPGDYRRKQVIIEEISYVMW